MRFVGSAYYRHVIANLCKNRMANKKLQKHMEIFDLAFVLSAIYMTFYFT